MNNCATRLEITSSLLLFAWPAEPREGRRPTPPQGRVGRTWRTRAIGLILAALPIAAGPSVPAAAQSREAGTTQLPAGMEIKVKAEPEHATVGDPVRIDFDILVPRGYQLQFPDLTGQLGDFTVLQTFPGPSLPDAGTASGRQEQKSAAPSSAPDSKHHYARILAALYKPGEYVLPSVPLSLRDPSGKQVSIPGPSVKVRIESVLTGKEESLRELKKQAEIPETVRWLLWFAILLLAAIVAGIAWWLWRRRRRQILPIPPRSLLDPLQLAEAELRDLLGRGLLEKNLVKPFYVALSEIVKRVLEAGYGIHTLEKTTAEIMEELRSAHLASMPSAEFDRIESFLIGCDLVKFAKNIPTREENESSSRRAFEILESCRKHRGPAVSPKSVEAEGVRE